MDRDDDSRPPERTPYHNPMSKPKSSRPRAGRWVFATSVTLAIVMTTAVIVLAFTLPMSDSERLFAETGPFEEASPWLWIVLALSLPLIFRKFTLEIAAGMVVSLAAAAREWDWHIAFTEYSVLKPPFYYREGTLPERIVAGGIVLVVIAGVVILLARLIHLRAWKRPWAWWVFALGFAFFMLAFSKAVDRAPGILRDDLGVDMSDQLRVLCYAVEEGLEMLLPVFFGAHALALARWHKKSPGTGSPPAR